MGESMSYNGLLLMRPQLRGQFDLQADIDDAFKAGRFGSNGEKLVLVVSNSDPQNLLQILQDASDEILTKAGLPDGVAQQIRNDICSIGQVVGQMCSFASKL